MTSPYVQAIEAHYNTALQCIVTHLKIYTLDYKQLSWPQVWQAFAAVYPNRWAIELHPPEQHLVDQANVYHLWMLPEVWQPGEMNIHRLFEKKETDNAHPNHHI